MKEVGLTPDYILQDLKKEAISDETLTYLLSKFQPMELVNKRSRKIKELSLNLSNMSNEEIVHYLKEEYSFIKRPIVIDGEHCFVGNGKDVRAALKDHIAQSS